MPPRRAAMCGTRAPTAKNRVATAIPNWPVELSRAMIDQVILSSGRVALHAPGIGGGAAAAADLGGGGEAAFGPVRSGLHDMPALLQIIDGRLRHPVLDHHHARPRRSRPERDREMLGMPRRRVDRLLQVQLRVDVTQEELRGPLILLVATGRTPGEVGFAVAQRHGRRERGARTFAWRQRCGMVFLQPENLRAAAEAETEFRDHRRGLQPAARRILTTEPKPSTEPGRKSSEAFSEISLRRSSL